MPTKTASMTAERMRPALRLEAITLLWMVVEASVSIGAGIAAGSLLLIAFGADSVIELISAGVLFWRLRLEAMAQPDDTEMVEAVERRASRIGGYLLYVLSAYVVLQALYGLTHRHHSDQQPRPARRRDGDVHLRLPVLGAPGRFSHQRRAALVVAGRRRIAGGRPTASQGGERGHNR